MPPEVRARVEARLKAGPAGPERRIVNSEWLDLIGKSLRDDPDGLAFLRRIAAKEDFAAARQGIERKIEELLKLHPEWR